jgi:hypothetical protein
MHGNTQTAVAQLDESRLRMIGRRRAMEKWLYEGCLDNPYERGTPEWRGFALVAGEIEGQELHDQQMRGYC